MRYIAAIAVGIAMAACATPPAGPVTTAEQAIQIVIAKCANDSGAAHAREASQWKAARDGETWHLTFLLGDAIPPGFQGDTPQTADVDAKTGEMTHCIVTTTATAD